MDEDLGQFQRKLLKLSSHGHIHIKGSAFLEKCLNIYIVLQPTTAKLVAHQASELQNPLHPNKLVPPS